MPLVRQSTDKVSAETIGARLKRLRLERGLSQRELSSPGVSYAYISRIEAGARTPSVKALRKLAQQLGVSVEYLETGREIGEEDERELRLADAELELRLGGDLHAAEETLRQLAAEAARAGDRASATRAEMSLGLAAAARGNHLEAIERLEHALAGDGVPARSRVDVYAALGRAYAAVGAPERAVKLFEECLAEVSRDAPDDVSTQIRYAAYLSYALSDAGDHERAAAVVKEALARAGPEADLFTQVRLYWSLARAVGIEGRSREALEYIRRAIALLQATDDTVRLGRAYVLAAGIEAGEGDVEDADAHIQVAERFLGGSAEPADLGMLHMVHAQIALARRDGERAVEEAQRALVLLRSFHGGEQGEASLTLARALAMRGEEAISDEAYRRALDLLVVHGRTHEAAEAAAEWGQSLRERGREDEAAPILARAAELRGAKT